MNNYLIPIIILIILFYGLFHHCDLYDSFLNGAKEGLKMQLSIIPPILAMIFAVNVFLKSNFLNIISQFIFKLFNLNFPLEILPMAVLRPISGNATLAILNNIFKLYGPDSFIGNLASTIEGCTDTTIYVLAVYFGSIKVKKGRYALGVGLFADLMGIIASIIIVSIFFK